MSSAGDITAVIPFHNFPSNAKYLHSLLRSITNKRFNIIVVCDAIEKFEFDALIEKYRKNPQIKFLYVNFRSAAKTRNEGLSKATSKWVVFWDCDDKVDEEMYLKVLDDHSGQDLDLIVGQIESFDSDTASIVSKSSTYSIQSLGTYPAFTRIIYSRLFIGGHLFPAILLCEDQCFLGLLIVENPKIRFASEILYSYRVNNPIQGSNTLFDIESHIEAIDFMFGLRTDLTYKDGVSALKILRFRLILSTLKRLKPTSLKYLLTLTRFFLHSLISDPWLLKFSRPKRIKHKSQSLTPTVILVGGLGNQLFQYAFMVSQFKGEKFEINGNLGRPRVSVQGHPDIFSFSIPEKLTYTANFYWIKSKISILLLNLSSYGSRNLISKILFQGLKLLNRSVAALNGGQGLIFLADGVGYFDENLPQNRRYRYYIGCFHSYVWAETIERDKLKSLFTLKEESPWIVSFREQFQNNRLGIAHIRRGDYLKVTNLGYLTLEYFEREMLNAIDRGTVQQFIVISDEPAIIQRDIDVNLRKKIVIVEENQEDAATNLLAFSVAGYFVLSNSSFSWWGAYLSMADFDEVVVPEYWYADKRSPRLIYPDSWTVRRLKN